MQNRVPSCQPISTYPWVEKANARLKRLPAEKELATDILNEVAKGNILSPELLRRRAVRMGEKFGASDQTDVLIGHR